jgi:hypothetical protein
MSDEGGEMSEEGETVGRSDHFILFQHSSGAWCSAPPGFRNILLDPIGRGESRVEAVRELFRHPEFVARARKGEWPPYAGFGAFVEVPEPECAMFADRRPESGRPTYRAERRRQSFTTV